LCNYRWAAYIDAEALQAATEAAMATGCWGDLQAVNRPSEKGADGTASAAAAYELS